VQKHDATRLHYDFRLEMDGVLKSWAVPKGPSLNPGDKRLRCRWRTSGFVLRFEGNIPEGKLRGGQRDGMGCRHMAAAVAVAAEWQVCAGTDAEAREMLAKGDLKFRLNGKRLKGDFALIKMRGRRPGSKGNEWLLIKKHDDAADEGYDIEEFDESVLSKRSMAEIAGDAGSAEWKSSRPAGAGGVKAAWLADAIAKLDQKKKTNKSNSTPVSLAAGHQAQKNRKLTTEAQRSRRYVRRQPLPRT